MNEYASQQRKYARRHPDEAHDAPRDLRNDELEQDVACCLDEIDEVLGREAEERNQAQREFAAFDRTTTNRELNRWQAKYAHLGLKYGRNCCGTPYMYDERDGE